MNYEFFFMAIVLFFSLLHSCYKRVQLMTKNDFLKEKLDHNQHLCATLSLFIVTGQFKGEDKKSINDAIDILEHVKTYHQKTIKANVPLGDQLKAAIKNEDYEKAQSIKDQLQKVGFVCYDPDRPGGCDHPNCNCPAKK